MAATETEIVQGIGSDYEIKYGFHADENYFFKSGRGLSHELVDAISSHKSEPDWMRKFRHRSLDYFLARPLPTWGGDLTGIDFENIFYYIRPTENQASSWADLPSEIRDTWDKLGIPEAEKKYLAGVGAQYESEMSRGAPPLSIRATPCTARSSRSWSRRTRAAATRRSRTGRTTSTTS